MHTYVNICILLLQWQISMSVLGSAWKSSICSLYYWTLYILCYCKIRGMIFVGVIHDLTLWISAESVCDCDFCRYADRLLFNWWKRYKYCKVISILLPFLMFSQQVNIKLSTEAVKARLHCQLLCTQAVRRTIFCSSFFKDSTVR